VKSLFRKADITIALILCAAVLSAGPAHAALVQYTVNTADDHDDGVCSADDCTLREAILAANLDGQDTHIRFTIPGPGPHVITITSRLPPLTEDGTAIDGTTQPGYGPGPAVVLAGDYTIPVPVGLEIQAGNCAVRGLSLIQFVGDWNGDVGAVFIRKGSGNIIEKNHIGIAPVAVQEQNTIGVRIASNDQTVLHNVLSNNSLAIQIMDGVSLQTIQGNRIGTDPSGMTAVPNSFGIRVEENTSRVFIGGPGQGNQISGNTAGAVSINGVEHVIQGNVIGMDAAGTAALPNHEGIGICGQAEGFQIGGTGPGEGNLISGNYDMGIFIGSGRHVIQGNKIGVDVTGTQAFGNLDGIVLSSCSIGVVQYASHDVQVGGAMGSGAENVISGNISYGISILTDDHVVQGNFIGTDGSGSTAVPTLHGVGITITGINNLIGGTAVGRGNVISGNARGIVILDDDNQVVGNRIGTDRNGSIPLGNEIGVQIFSSNNFVGTGAPGAGNLISGNVVGVAVEMGQHNRILGNRIGTDDGGTAAVPNQVGIAVGLDYDYQPHDTIIGAPGAGNQIAWNDQCGILFSEKAFLAEVAENTIHNNGGSPGGLCAGQGIALVGTYEPVERVTITKNSIFQNGGLGIELIGNLANLAIDPPTMELAGNSTLEGWIACVGCRVEVFLADPDPTGYGEGMTFLAETFAGTDGSFSVPVSGYDSNDFFTATATVLQNTSEFSENVRGPATVPICALWLQIPILTIIGGVCGAVLGRRFGRRKIPWAAAGTLLGAGLGTFALFLSFALAHPPPLPSKEETGFSPPPICSRLLDESRSGPPEGAVFAPGTDVLLEAHPISMESDSRIRWRLAVVGPDGASAERDFSGGFSIHLSELGLNPSTMGIYSWRVFAEREDTESGGWVPLCRERLGRSFSIRPDRTYPNPVLPIVWNAKPDGGVPAARTQNIANCRSGPGMDYRVITILPQAGVYPINGRDPDGLWWRVRLPGGLGSCWVAGENVVVEGDPQGVTEVEPPPLGCWVYSGGVTTSGGYECVVPCPEGAEPGGVCEP
jgi:CSLREA domain-containing protein